MKSISISTLLFLSVQFLCSSATAQLYLSNGDTLFISPGEQIFIDADLEVAEGATIINHAAAGINLTGTAGIQGKIDYSALANQYILPYHHKTLHIGGSGNKLLTADINISDHLQLGGTAKLITGNYLLALSGNNSTISGTHAFGINADSWIVTGNGNSGENNTGLGGLKITGIGNSGRSGNILFPVGPSIFNYNPVTILNTGTTDDYTVAVNDQVVPGADITKSVEATWNISEAVNGGSNIELGTQWTAADEAGNFMRPACRIVHSDGTVIDYNAAVAAAAGNDPFTRTGAGFTSFSPFGVTSDGIVLPVTFIRIVAYQLQETVQVEWETAAETAISYYEVQRSTDNIRFIKVGRVDAAAITNYLVPYNFTDAAPQNGLNYYRIKSVGTNGAIKFSSIAKVNYAAKPGSISAYPNPVVDNKITVEFKNKKAGVYNISLLNTNGALVYQKKMIHDGGNYKYILPLPATLARELYQMNIDGPDGTRTLLKIMIHY